MGYIDCEDHGRQIINKLVCDIYNIRELVWFPNKFPQTKYWEDSWENFVERWTKQTNILDKGMETDLLLESIESLPPCRKNDSFVHK